MAFLGPGDFLILEQITGRVQHVVNGNLVGTAIDLPVNFASERGALGIALHPNFQANGYVYLYWTLSSTGQDSSVLSDVALLGNRVDRFVWNGSTLTFDRPILQLRAFQADANQPLRGNHNGGKVAFGPDGKLYVYIGDNGRRGQTQNLPDGPGPAGNSPDDQFGGPQPDTAHATGVIFRLNDDGSTPTDNPFYRAGALRGGEVGATLQKVFAYGARNSFGMAFDPLSGFLWEAENGDDSFSEINRVEAGSNLGWVQLMGPLARVAQFKAIETSTAIDPVTNSSYFGLQQVRWLPTNIADTPRQAFVRLFQVFEGGDRFGATLDGSDVVPAAAGNTGASLAAEYLPDGTLHFTLTATTAITGVTEATIQLAARTQNGPVVAKLFLNAGGVNFTPGQIISDVVIRDSDVAEAMGFDGTAFGLAERMRQGRAAVIINTTGNPAGATRGQIVAIGTQVSHYTDPEMSWKYEVAPTGLGFLSSNALGGEYTGDMFVGQARVFLNGGSLFHLELTADRRRFQFKDARLFDRVADNAHKFDITESESLLFGTGFGIVTDIQTGPNGNLYVVSLSDGAVYEIFKPSLRARTADRYAMIGRTSALPEAAATSVSVRITQGRTVALSSASSPADEGALLSAARTDVGAQRLSSNAAASEQNFDDRVETALGLDEDD